MLISHSKAEGTTPDWVMEAALKAGDIAYRWNLHSDMLQWWLPDSDLAQDNWPDRGHLLMSRIHPQDLPTRMEALSRHLHKDARYECDFRLRMNNESFAWIHDRGKATQDGTGGICLTGLMRPITERKISEENHRDALLRDPVTLHMSRRCLREEIARVLIRLRSEDRHASLLTLRFAHEQVLAKSGLTEEALAILAAALDECLSPPDCAASLKNGQFALLMAEGDPGEIERRSERLRDVIAKYATRMELNPHVFALHIASLLFNGAAYKPDTILTRGEEALEKAYRLGQSDYSANLSDSSLALDAAREKTQIIYQAKLEGKLYLLHQPIVQATDHKIIAYESLLRMRGEGGLFQNAAHFIPDLELLGDIRWLDRHVLDMVIDHLRKNPELHLSMNISGLTVNDPTWVRALRLALLGKPCVAPRLIIEITETTAIADHEDTDRFIRHIRDMGCRVAIDDFGAGFTSFRQLKGLAVDLVKIDGDYIQDILRNADHQLFIRHLTHLAKEMNFATLAEFVETEEQADFLTQAGIDYLQGYYFGKPSDLPLIR